MKKLYHSKCSCSHGEYTLPPVSVANNTHTHTDACTYRGRSKHGGNWQFVNFTVLSDLLSGTTFQ